MGPKRISQGAGICAGTIAPGCRKRGLDRMILIPGGIHARRLALQVFRAKVNAKQPAPPAPDA